MVSYARMFGIFAFRVHSHRNYFQVVRISMGSNSNWGGQEIILKGVAFRILRGCRNYFHKVRTLGLRVLKPLMPLWELCLHIVYAVFEFKWLGCVESNSIISVFCLARSAEKIVRFYYARSAEKILRFYMARSALKFWRFYFARSAEKILQCSNSNCCAPAIISAGSNSNGWAASPLIFQDVRTRMPLGLPN